MKKICLQAGQFTLVDDEDFEYLNQWKWHIANGYVKRTQYLKGDKKELRKRTTIQMHRVIMNTPIGMETDHRDGNKLNNQKNNLRFATRSQNMMNIGLRKDNVSGIKGVSWNKRDKKWQPQICINQKIISLGYCNSKEEAIEKYNKKARELFGEFNYA